MAVRWTDRSTTRLEKGWVKDHAYGDGWVKKNAGWKWTGAQYYDAKWVKKAITRLVLVETLGGIAPPTKQFLHVFANKEVAGTTRTGVWGGVGDQHQQAGAHWGH